MSSRRVVKKSNALTNAAYTTTLAEQRLILLAIAQGGGRAADLKSLTVHARDYAEQYGVQISTAYEALQDAAGWLFERRFSYQSLGPKGQLRRVVSRWVSRVEYGQAEGLITLRFSDDVLPYLCDLEEKFTQYALEQVADLKSVHALRLYELLIAWRSLGKTPAIEVDELRRRLGLEDGEYPRMDNFKRRVLDFAIKQINQHTDIVASYEQHKRGRSITGFSFSFKVKGKGSDQPAPALTSEPKRQTITKRQAEGMARPGELWPELYARLGRDYIIT